MSFYAEVLKNDEKAIYNLRSLYRDFGYSLYKVSKFEEYDLYAHNKSFLVSQNILTFTDTNGKLLALKPDVTLSIVKNIPDGETRTHKLCYNETVYRTSSDSDGFREIMQTGLECIGEIDLYSECEVIMLAMRSLDTISKDYILDLSHMGIIDGLLSEAGIDGAVREKFIRRIENKNVSALLSLCETYGVSSDMQKRLATLCELYMPIDQALKVLKDLVVGEKMALAYDSLSRIRDAMEAYGLVERLYLDFSIVSDVNYYDEICFKGFINGIPNSVLSGGRYDKLLSRLGKKAGAIGFAVYLDRLERFENTAPQYDVDAVLTYEAGTDIRRIMEAQKMLTSKGLRVVVGHAPDLSQSYRELLKLTDGGIEVIERHD